MIVSRRKELLSSWYDAMQFTSTVFKDEIEAIAAKNDISLQRVVEIANDLKPSLSVLLPDTGPWFGPKLH